MKIELSKSAVIRCVVGAIASTLIVLNSTEVQAEINLPSQVTWTAYDVGSSGYNQSIAIGGALKNELGVDLRVLPGKNDVSRQLPLRQGKVDFSATGVGGSFMAQEGVFEFSSRNWGPQRVRLLLSASGTANIGMAAATDSGIKTVADLKGRRVAWVVGSPAMIEGVRAHLAFAGLNWDDVEKVEFGGYGASWKGVINGQADAVFGIANAGPAFQLASSPRGITWLPLPHDDAEGWKRLQEKGPVFTPNTGTSGAGLAEGETHEGGRYPYPILVTYSDRDEEKSYQMTKALVELFPAYKDTAPGVNGWALDRQKLTWAVPYHKGAIRYLREIGEWTAEHDAHNDNLLKRQDVLAAAWEEFIATDVADADFQDAWMKLRAQRLNDAGFEAVYN